MRQWILTTVIPWIVFTLLPFLVKWTGIIMICFAGKEILDEFFTNMEAPSTNVFKNCLVLIGIAIVMIIVSITLPVITGILVIIGFIALLVIPKII